MLRIESKKRQNEKYLQTTPNEIEMLSSGSGRKHSLNADKICEVSKWISSNEQCRQRLVLTSRYEEREIDNETKSFKLKSGTSRQTI